MKFCHFADQCANDAWIQLTKSLCMNLFQHQVRRLGFLVYAIQRHGVEYIYDPNNFPIDVNRTPFQPDRIPSPVYLLMMLQSSQAYALINGCYIFQQLIAVGGMSLHLSNFLCGKRLWLVQYGRIDFEVTDIME